MMEDPQEQPGCLATFVTLFFGGVLLMLSLIVVL